jgi:hypothetical protein
VGRLYAVAFGSSGAGTVVADDMAQVLHHGERGREVKWGPRKARRGTASGSPSGRTAVVSRRKSGREARALASEADGSILGRTGEVAACLSAIKKEQGERAAGRWPTPFCGGSEARVEREGAGGSGDWRRVEGKNGGGV